MVLLLLCTAQFMIVLDVTIVAVALPAIRDDVGFPAAGLQWVITAYTLAFGGLLVSAGRAADVFGRRRLFMLGLALFAAASAGCGFAGSPTALVATRALQGVGAALLAPAALALVTELPDQSRALALWTAAAAGGGAAGWVLGGVLTETVGWQAIFLANVPVAVAGAALVLGLTQRPAAVPLGIALLAAFVLVERRVAAPVLPPGTFANRTFTRAVIAALALTAATTPAMLLSILERDGSPIEIGLACLPFNVAVIGGSLLAGRVRVPLPLGLLGVAAGVLLVGAATLPGYVLMGASLGVSSVASTASGTAALAASRGLASGILTAAAQIGPALGLALASGYTVAAALAAAAILPFARFRSRSKQSESCAEAYAHGS